MKRSESIKEIAGALSKFQGEVTNPKNSAKNPQFNSKYAPLQDILSLVRPILGKYGLSILQSTTGDLENVTITTMLLHESGEFLEMEPFVLKGEQTLKGGAKVLNVQGAGSMITYVRRYQASAMLGLASEDDDGNHASGKDDNVHDDTEKEETTVTAKMLIDMAKSKGIDEASICKKYKASEIKFIKQEDKKAEYESLKHEGEKLPLIDKNKIESIQILAEKKGVKEASICAAYNITKFEQMNFDNWKLATDKLNLKPDHVKNDLDGII